MQKKTTPMGSAFFLFYFLSVSAFLLATSSEQVPLTDLNLENPVTRLSPSPLVDYSSTRAAKDIFSCGRVRVAGVSRLKIWSYANSYRVTLTPLEVPEKLHGKIEVCFHRNASIGLCQCEKGYWRAIQTGQWSTVMSPYEVRYVDVKFMNGLSGTVEVSVEEEFHRWRLLCLALGFVLLLLAPICCKWVPFYYSSSMAVGILLVVLIILFQGMKLFPTGRKSALYFTIYGSVIGAGSFLLHYFSILVSSILQSFGLSEDMYSPVSVFLIVGVVLGGAALGYWIVRKFVISEDGSVDVGIAQFVKWAMRVIAMTSIFQSTLDVPLALAALACCWGSCSFITSLKKRGSRSMRGSYPVNKNLWLQRTPQATTNRNRAEFLSRSSKRASGSWSSPKSALAWSDSPTKGLVVSSPNQGAVLEQDYYSTFHKTPRKRFSKKEWEDFTRESTRQAMAEWASSPEFTDWLVDNADRIRIDPDTESMVSGSDSSEETVVDNSNGLNLFKW